MSPLPQDEPSDDFKAGWDKAIEIVAFLIKPAALPAMPDYLDKLVFKNGQTTVATVLTLRGEYKFRSVQVPK